MLWVAWARACSCLWETGHFKSRVPAAEAEGRLLYQARSCWTTPAPHMHSHWPHFAKQEVRHGKRNEFPTPVVSSRAGTGVQAAESSPEPFALPSVSASYGRLGGSDKDICSSGRGVWGSLQSLSSPRNQPTIVMENPNTPGSSSKGTPSSGCCSFQDPELKKR